MRLNGAPLADRSDVLAALALHVHAADVNTEQTGQIRANAITCAGKPRPLEYDRAVEVTDRVARRANTVHGGVDEVGGVPAVMRGVIVGKEPPDVRFSERTKKCVGDGVEQGVPVRVRPDALVVLEADPAENERPQGLLPCPPRFKAMEVVAVSHSNMGNHRIRGWHRVLRAAHRGVVYRRCWNCGGDCADVRVVQRLAPCPGMLRGSPDRSEPADDSTGRDGWASLARNAETCIDGVMWMSRVVNAGMKSCRVGLLGAMVCCGVLSALTGCRASLDRHVYASSAWYPQTVTLMDTRTGESIWSVDVPVGKQLIVGFRDGVGPNADKPDVMYWSITDAGRRASRGKSHMAVPDETARVLVPTKRTTPESSDASMPGPAEDRDVDEY